MIYLSKCNLLYQSIFITLQDIQNYPVVDTTGYLNPQLLKVKWGYLHPYAQAYKIK
jgi:hypothetical protein